MKLAHLLALTMPLALLACTDGNGTDNKDTDTDADSDTEVMDTDTMDTDVPDPPELAWDISGWTGGYADAINCADDNLLLQLRTQRWGYDAEVYLGDTRFDPPWQEAGHLMTETDTSGSDYDVMTGVAGYSVFELDLDNVDTIGEVMPGETTLFGCDDLDPAETNFSITYAAVVYDSGGAVADCIVFGHDADGLIAGTVAGLTPPSWLTAGNCTAVD
jgi:hypothetical protein